MNHSISGLLADFFAYAEAQKEFAERRLKV